MKQLPKLRIEDASESVRLAEEYAPFRFSGSENFESKKIYLFAAPNTPDLERFSTEHAVRLARDAPVLLLNSRIESIHQGRLLKNAGVGDLPIRNIRIKRGTLVHRYEEMCEWIRETNARAIVINCYEAAAETTRHRTSLAYMLNDLIDEFDIAVFVYSYENITKLRIARDQKRGPLAMIAYFANEILEAGSQLTVQEKLNEPRYKEFMREQATREEAAPPPPLPEDIPPLPEFNGMSIETYIVPEDMEEEWFKESVESGESGMGNREWRMENRK
jgi:hypothetical protein